MELKKSSDVNELFVVPYANLGCTGEATDTGSASSGDVV